MRVLVVDDDEITLALIRNALEHAGYDVELARNGAEALELLRSGRYRLVISDWEMPEMDGLELCRRIRARHYSGYVYVILVTAHDGVPNVVEALDAGADDFVSKPVEPAELCVRLRAGERILSLDSRDMTIFALAKLAESRDNETGAHLERIREYCRVIAGHLAQAPRFRDEVDGDYVEMIYLTSPLHDIGKVGIPDRVLLKPGRLTAEEFEIMKSHTSIGARTLQAAAEKQPEARFLQMARDIALTHHERYDGTGYPRGLRADEIPLCGRIVALADVYDALTTRRPYKEAFAHERARSIIQEGRGTHFDPDLVEVFLAEEAMFVAIRQGFAESESDAESAPLSVPAEAVLSTAHL